MSVRIFLFVSSRCALYGCIRLIILGIVRQIGRFKLFLHLQLSRVKFIKNYSKYLTLLKFAFTSTESTILLTNKRVDWGMESCVFFFFGLWWSKEWMLILSRDRSSSAVLTKRFGGQPGSPITPDYKGVAWEPIPIVIVVQTILFSIIVVSKKHCDSSGERVFL